MGLLAVLFGMAISLGLTMAVGLYYTTIHGVMAFLVLGIGIDDMFVIVQCFNNLSKEEKSIPSVAERIGLTMKHAGVAITVTSLTNVFAFGIGAITVGVSELGVLQVGTGFWNVECDGSHVTSFFPATLSAPCIVREEVMGWSCASGNDKREVHFCIRPSQSQMTSYLMKGILGSVVSQFEFMISRGRGLGLRESHFWIALTAGS